MLPTTARRMVRDCTALLALVVFLAACGGDSTDPPAVATIEVTPATADRNVGETVQLSATVKDANGNVLSGQSVEWSSSAPTVASVSTSGLVTTNAVGTAIITAAVGSKVGVATITVTQTDRCSTTLAPSITVGQTINGALAPTDCKFEDDSTYLDGYAITVTTATNVQIDMTATFDTYLYLVELLPTGNLVLRAENDDVVPDVDTNSRITFTLQPNLMYFILANSFDANTFGNYQLKVTAVSFVAGSSVAGKPGKAPVSSLLKALRPAK